jgi:hypothetical protein
MLLKSLALKHKNPIRYRRLAAFPKSPICGVLPSTLDNSAQNCAFPDVQTQGEAVDLIEARLRVAGL